MTRAALTLALVAVAVGVAAVHAPPAASKPLSGPATPSVGLRVAPAVAALTARLTGRVGSGVDGDDSWFAAGGNCAGDYGCADIPGNVLHVRGYLVAMLNRIADGGYVQPYQAALAVLVYCHEARHVRGTRDERVAERWAVYHAVTVARLLGATPAWAARMGRWIPTWDDRVG